MPDPSCNPYLAFAVMLKSGLDGMRNEVDPGHPVNEALKALSKDEVVKEALGGHIYERFVESKKKMWHDYSAQVHPWELEQYLSTY
jgi:glutamine synthetase